MAQHHASLEKTLQSVFKHKKVGTEVATAVVGIEALVVSGINTVTSMVQETDAKTIRQVRAGVAHKAFGKRIVDAMKTIDAIIAAEALSVVPTDKAVAGKGSAHKAMMKAQVIKEISSKKMGTAVSDMVTKVEQAVDQLLVIYGVGGAKADANVAAVLTAIRAIVQG